MTVAANPDYYEKRFNWTWSCSSCLFSHTSQGFTAADIDDALKGGVRCPACSGIIEQPRKLPA